MENNTVYKYTNKQTGKIYIGRTMQKVEKRAGSNGINYKTCTKFWNAIKKYGWENFELEILAQNVSYEKSIELEKYYIEYFQSDKQKYGYNILQQEPNRGSLPDEVKQRISNTRKNFPDEMKKRLAESHFHGITPWNKGIKTGPLTEKQKEKFSEARKGNTNSVHVYVRNIDTGEVFRSGAAAGRSVGCTSEAIFTAIKENRPCKGYMFERIDKNA